MIEFCKLIAVFINGIYNIELKIFENDIKVGTIFISSLVVFFCIKQIFEIGADK